MSRKRSSDLQAPRKRGPNKESSQPYTISEHDREMAQAVCQVVNDLISQVAGEPYGDLSRKRPPFFCVIRKFVKDAVQAFHDAAAADYMERTFKRRKRTCEEEESPYGLDLVCGLIMAEMEKVDKRERARVYSSQKAARNREKKKQEAIEAARATEYPLWHGMLSDNASNDEDEEDKRANPSLLQATITAIIAALAPLEVVAEPKAEAHHSPQIVPPVTPGSDDSDCAIPSGSMHQVQSSQPSTPNTKEVDVQPQSVRNFSIFDRPKVGRGRGRGGRGAVRPPTVRSIIDGAMVPSGMNENEPRMHSHVSLRDSNQSMNMEPFFDFREKKFMYTIKGRGSTRGGRGRATRGKMTKTQTLQSIMEDDADKYQEYLMAAAIETSGESASQESLDDMSHTIDDVVKRVNGMSDAELKLNGETKREGGKKMMMEKTRVVKRRMSKPCEDGSTSGVKKRKNECDVVTIESSPSGKSNEDEKVVSALRTPSPIPFIIDSSDDESPNQKSTATDEDASSTTDDVIILDVPKPLFPIEDIP